MGPMGPIPLGNATEEDSTDVADLFYILSTTNKHHILKGP